MSKEKTRKCKKCNKIKEITEFPKREKNIYRYKCKVCMRMWRREYMKKWREDNKELVASYDKKYKENNKDLVYERKKRWRRENPDKHKAIAKRYRENNKEKVAAQNKKWREENKDCLREKKKIYVRNRKKTDIGFRISLHLRQRLNKALAGNKKSGSAVRDLGCTIEELKQHLEAKFVEGMSWENYGEWHIDHIIPLASFDLTKISQVKKACHYTNLQPLWAKDNLRKGAKR